MSQYNNSTACPEMVSVREKMPDSDNHVKISGMKTLDCKTE